MTCKLGLDNPLSQGGKFEGEGIASLLGKMRATLEKDKHTGRRTREEELANPRPIIWVNYSGLVTDPMFGNNQDVTSMFEDDAGYESIMCAGFGYDGPNMVFNISCINCTYNSWGKRK